MKKIRILSILNFIALLLHIAMSAAVQTKQFNNRDVAEVSNMFPTLFTPAGFTFSIWGIIYLTLMAMCIHHIAVSFRQNASHADNKAITKMGGWFILNNIATAAWLYVWTHLQIAIAEILIVIQLISLVAIHSRLDIYAINRPLSNKIFTQVPLSIYLGWISIATIANTAVYLTSLHWSGWGLPADAWTLIMIIIALVLSIAMIFLRDNVFFALVVVWALAGIFFRQHQTYYPMVDTTALISFALIIGAILIRVFRFGQPQSPGMPHTA